MQLQDPSRNPATLRRARELQHPGAASSRRAPTRASASLSWRITRPAIASSRSTRTATSTHVVTVEVAAPRNAHRRRGRRRHRRDARRRARYDRSGALAARVPRADGVDAREPAIRASSPSAASVSIPPRRTTLLDLMPSVCSRVALPARHRPTVTTRPPRRSISARVSARTRRTCSSRAVARGHPGALRQRLLLHRARRCRVASHAWVDVWLGGSDGWLSLDVTHAIAAGERHCRLAVGRDYLDAAPVRGVRRGGGREQLERRRRALPCPAQRHQQQ